MAPFVILQAGEAGFESFEHHEEEEECKTQVDNTSSAEVSWRRMKKTASPFQNGVPELVLLRLLATREMYGYELVKEIKNSSRGLFSYGEGCIYPILHYLEAEKLVTSRQAEAEGRTRTYYRITACGRNRLSELREQWSRVAQGITLSLGQEYV
jgi:PadR family transcriptional regulator, regulatory protein PadR